MGRISAPDPPELLHRLAVMCDTSGISQFVDCHRFAFTFLENQSQESKARFFALYFNASVQHVLVNDGV